MLVNIHNSTTRRIWSGPKIAQNASFWARMCFLGVDNVSLNFGSQTPKSEIFGPWIGMQAWTTKIQTFITSTLLCRSWQHFYMGQPPWMSLRGWSHDFLKKIKMADGGHIEFRKNVNVSWIHEDFAHSFVQWCKTRQTTNNICKTAFSLQCSRERSDDYNF